MKNKKHVYSASQVATFLQCQRKWAWSKIDKIEVPPHPSAQLGTRVHAVAEQYFRTGQINYTDHEAACIFEAGLENNPALADVAAVEKHFTLDLPFGSFVGYKDLVLNSPEVVDHKTTSSFRYLKTEEELRQDPQANIYALEECLSRGVDGVWLRWIYYRTKGARKSDQTRFFMLREDAERYTSEVIEPTVSAMNEAHASCSTAVELPPSPEHCEAYGGCAFRHKCNLTPEERMMSIMSMTNGQGTTSLIDSLRKRANINPPEFQPPPAPTPVAVVETAATPVAVVETAQAPVAVVETATPVKRKRTAKANAEASEPDSKPIGTLYIDCVTDGAVSAEATIIPAAKAAVHKELGVADYRFVDFAKGAGALVAAVYSIVKSAPVEHLTLSSSTPEGSLILSTLVELSNNQVRGIK